MSFLQLIIGTFPYIHGSDMFKALSLYVFIFVLNAFYINIYMYMYMYIYMYMYMYIYRTSLGDRPSLFEDNAVIFWCYLPASIA
jgi:hypothetical protein